MSKSNEDSKMVSNQIIGSPGNFEIGMDITIFESKLTNSFLANSIENNVQKRAILLSSISEEIHKVLFSLCVPRTPNDVEYETLMKSLNNYYKPVKSYFAARHAFYQAKKRQDESVCQWGARVKNLASKCGFSSELSTVIRDIFVVGIDHGPIQDRLLEEDASKVTVTYSSLMEIAMTKEAAMNDKSDWKKEEGADLKYHRKTKGPSQAKRNSNAAKESKEKCGVCGRSNHHQKDCRYKDYECNNCGNKGHLSTVCKNGSSGPCTNQSRIMHSNIPEEYFSSRGPRRITATNTIYGPPTDAWPSRGPMRLPVTPKMYGSPNDALPPYEQTASQPVTISYGPQSVGLHIVTTTSYGPQSRPERDSYACAAGATLKVEVGAATVPVRYDGPLHRRNPSTVTIGRRASHLRSAHAHLHIRTIVSQHPSRPRRLHLFTFHSNSPQENEVLEPTGNQIECEEKRIIIDGDAGTVVQPIVQPDKTKT